MGSTTTRFGAPYPAETDTNDVPRDVEALANTIDTNSAMFAQGTAATRPAPGKAGRFYWATDNKQLFYDDGAAWQLAGRQTVTVPQEHTYAVSGSVAVASGSSNYLPPFFVRVPAGTTKKLVGVRAMIRAGTSATYKVQRNGADVVGLTGIQATTVPSTTTLGSSLVLGDGDRLAVVVTGVTGTPDGLSVTMLFDAAV